MNFDVACIGQGLAFVAVVDDLDAAVRKGGAAVVQAPPGTGKTTLVPPVVANVVAGRVVVTQPRRVAARAAAARLAALTGTQLGSVVGYTVRGDRRLDRGARIEMCTAGVLLRRLLNDPELDGVGAVVVDEVHERALESDLVVGMVAELRELRPELVLVVMSATLDAERWAGLLGEVPVVAADAVLHPLETRYLPYSGSPLDSRGVRPEFLDHVADCCVEVAPDDGNVLAFLPGARECDEVVARLQRRGLVAEPLYGSLPPRAQDAALRADGPPRIIVATSVAESSLTVPGVRTVVDAGLSREPRFDLARGVSGLVTVREARSSAEQRAGRAARLGSGLAVRLFPEADWAGMRPFTVPEILTTDLTQAALDLAAWGTPGGVGLALPDAAPTPALDVACRTLRGLGALDDEGSITPRGRRLAALPVEARLGRALLECAPRWGAQPVAEIVALLSGDERIDDADLVATWRRLRATGTGPWRREAERLARLAEHPSKPGTDDEIAGDVIATAFPDRIARRRDSSDDYLLASGTGATLPRGSRLVGQEWVAVGEFARVGERAVIRAAAPITEEAALRAGDGLREETTEVMWSTGKVSARRITCLGAIRLSEVPVRPTVDDAHRAVRETLQREGLGLLVWSDEASTFRRRVALLHHVAGQPWPDVSEAALLERLDDWFGPELDRLAAGASAASLNLVAALRRLLPWPAAARFDELVPERIEVPTGSHIRLQYPDDPTDRVVLAVKLQECFGLLDTPRLVEGTVPVLMHLLSPAQRPLAVTDDLASFWANAYPSVRAENRGRYSKHPWPEDPLTAPPRRGTTKSGK